MKLPVNACLIIAILISLSGCATWQSRIPATDSEQSSHMLSAWQASGKASLRLQDKTINANLRWQRQQNDFRAELSGPFGQGHTELSWKNQLLTIENDTLGVITSTKPDVLLALIVDTAIPFSSLNQWLMGWPAQPLTDIRYRSSDGEPLRRFVESGWTVSLMQEQHSNGYRVARKVIIEQPSTRLMVVFTDWSSQP